jgi:hypothetical protein
MSIVGTTLSAATQVFSAKFPKPTTTTIASLSSKEILGALAGFDCVDLCRQCGCLRRGAAQETRVALRSIQRLEEVCP